jgi:hypothetical protein
VEITLLKDTTWVLTEGMIDAIVSGLLILGVGNCFFGRRMFRFTITLLGILAAAGGSAYGVARGLGERPAAIIAGAAVGGLLAAVLLIIFYRVALFTIGAAVGLGLSVGFCWLTATQIGLGLVIVFAVAGGLLMVGLERVMVVFISGAFGSLVTAAGVLHLSGRGPGIEALQATQGDPAKLGELVTTPVHVAMAGAVFLFVISVLIQLRGVTRKRSEDEKGGGEDES